MVTNRGGRGGRDDNAANHKRLELTWLRIVMSRIDHNWLLAFGLVDHNLLWLWFWLSRSQLAFGFPPSLLTLWSTEEHAC